MKPDAPAEVRGKFKPIQHQRPRHPDLRALPADGPDDGQGRADPQPAPQHRRDARERPALDDDRPRLQRRQHEAARRQRRSRACSARRASCRPTSSCPARSATPAPARCTARRPATSAAPTSRSSSNADPARPTSRSPTSKSPAGPDGSSALDARRKLLDQLDDLQRRTETPQHADARQRLRAGLPPADLARGQGGLRPDRGDRTSSATATAATRSARAA